MPYVTVGKENGANIDIYYKDWGKGQPIVFSHGWPLPRTIGTRRCSSSSARFSGGRHDRRGQGGRPTRRRTRHGSLCR